MKENIFYRILGSLTLSITHLKSSLQRTYTHSRTTCPMQNCIHVLVGVPNPAKAGLLTGGHSTGETLRQKKFLFPLPN